MNQWGWVKMQDEYSAWLQSPYSKQHQQRFSQSQIQHCQDCHMPLVAALDPSADRDGNIRSHRFPGANTVLPLLAQDHEHLDIIKRFLQSDKMRITIETPTRRDASQTGQSIDERFRAKNEQPHYYYLNKAVEVVLTVANVGVGHDFPGGTLDINEAWIALMVTDAQGKTVYRSGDIGDDGQVDPEAYFYRSLPIDRYGKQVWKHDLFNRVGETAKNRVPAGRSDIVRYAFNVPSWAKGWLSITAVLKYRKFNQRYAKWALQEGFQAIPVVDVARHTRLVPIREQSGIR